MYINSKEYLLIDNNNVVVRIYGEIDGRKEILSDTYVKTLNIDDKYSVIFNRIYEDSRVVKIENIMLTNIDNTNKTINIYKTRNINFIDDSCLLISKQQLKAFETKSIYSSNTTAIDNYNYNINICNGGYKSYEWTAQDMQTIFTLPEKVKDTLAFTEGLFLHENRDYVIDNDILMLTTYFKMRAGEKLKLFYKPLN